MSRSSTPAEQLNHSCDCSGTDMNRLRRQIDGALAPALSVSILDSHPDLFSEAPLFIESAHVDAMRKLIAAVHQVIDLPGYRERALEGVPEIARRPSAPLGVFTAFDFHITPTGPKLIEINTNAGGALLNAIARRAQPPCCDDPRFRVQPGTASLETEFVFMFRHEWALARGVDVPLRSIAIVDEDPRGQYLYPEFLLFQKLFAAYDIDTVIADPGQIESDARGIRVGSKQIDLVYNRLTDFYLEGPSLTALRNALANGSAVITPHPRAHALFAHKRNLALLTDAGLLGAIGAEERHIDTLISSIPRTVCVSDDDDTWWAGRKRWFFKPVDGYGSRGAYRGDKLTRRVFAEIVEGRYVAQELTPPGERWRTRGTAREAYKVDIRAYTYDGEIQLVAARLYQGQTTNFRTAGGGFAPVYEVTSS